MGDELDIGQIRRALCPIADHVNDPVGCELMLLAGHIAWRTAFINGQAWSLTAGRIEPRPLTSDALR